MIQAATKNWKSQTVQKTIQKHQTYHQEYRVKTTSRNFVQNRKFIKGNPDCYTSNFSRYVEYDLHPTFEQILSYVKDTNDFINKVKYLSLPKDSILLKNFTRR